MATWNYVVTAHKPTNVTHSAVGYFTGQQELNLIIAKCTRIEIHLLTPTGLKGIKDVSIYGRIATMELFRAPGESQDWLFISTERYKFCVLWYDSSTGVIHTKAAGDVSDRIGRPTDTGQIGIIDPESRLIGLHLYDGLFKVIPIDSKGLLKEAFNIRLEELSVLDMKFLYGCAKPTIAVLYQDTKEARHVKTYEIQLKEKDFAEGPWLQSNLDSGASLIIPVPPPLGGAIIVGEQTIVYHNGSVFKAISMLPATTRAYGRVDPDGSRYLLGDHLGMLHLLVIRHDKTRVLGLKLEKLGETSAASSLAYLDNGVVFVGSSFGDSQLVKLTPTPSPEGSYVEILESYTQLGPIVDFCVVDLERQGQGQVVTCSGAFKNGSLRIVRNGIGINEQAAAELPGIKGMWSLRASSAEPFDTFLVVAFIRETRVLAINESDELDETEIEGFSSDEQTLLCANAVYDQLVQVTSTSLRLINALTLQQTSEWRAPEGSAINVAASNASQVLLATGGGSLFYFEIGAGALEEKQSVKLEFEVACLDVSPLEEGEERAHLAAVGMWTDMSVRIFSLPGLTPVVKEKLGGEVIPRAVLFCSFEKVPYLLVALGDGHLFNFLVDASTGLLSDRKKLSLGTQPITLRTFRSKDAQHVFAASDRPTVIYSSNKKLLYSNVNLKEVTHMCPFNSQAFPDSLAIGKEGELIIGTIDEIQKLHIRTVPLKEQPRRIAHQESSRTLLVCTMKYSQTDVPGEETEAGFVKLFDDQTFEVVAVFALDAFECGCSVMSCSFSEDAGVYFVVGTAYAMPEESEPSKGRILVFSVEEQKLLLVHEKETKGAVYNLNAFSGKLLACINQKVALYRWVLREDQTRELQAECSHHGHILALFVQSRGDFIVVGDLMKSISLLMYKAEEGAIEERARDFNSNWMTAVEILDDDTYLGAENSFNLFTVRKNSDAATDEERSRLEVIGEFHLGEFINKFRHGSLVMRLPDSEAAHIPTVIYATVNGAIGVIASLPQDQFQFLHRLQTILTRVIKGVGDLSHEQWRSFSNEKKTSEARNFLDGDLIEGFLELPKREMEMVCKEMHTSVEDLSKKIEELSRLK
eukprot:TRINITY_DN26392_c0_g1_i1.p1 TRINITY_DN26392_c0_g1~~TRINITY_DN26392_c0_g1_i1.p1  ORF type:complete len:1092 (+),score=241.19 TRINITY_DN26392_c0_g1_i1:211-3486(+)